MSLEKEGTVDNISGSTDSAEMRGDGDKNRAKGEWSDYPKFAAIEKDQDRKLGRLQFKFLCITCSEKPVFEILYPNFLRKGVYEDGFLRVCDQKGEGRMNIVKKCVAKCLTLTRNKGHFQKK